MSSDSERSFKSMLDSVYSTASTTGIGGGSAKLHEPSGNTPINSPLARSVITTRRPPSIDDGYESPVPQDEAAAEKRNEVRYRDYLTHPYNVSLNLPRKLLISLLLVAVSFIYSDPTLDIQYGPLLKSRSETWDITSVRKEALYACLMRSIPWALRRLTGTVSTHHSLRC